ncbi:efflux RND transporter periplasmic adaptor subunit [Fontisphaera persica]|uniref:efflux RND transporter periplasmic adaptor subunit n=1 Tax=Fontisphaera persica TaxID=2974023 RepID=UPI0024BF4430|nr:efflux RND transporter periplasmic adaptor subunit [Fontisphaera persica]WCJ58978.1 efflux RND transporter periplasmic adaptor subunit [Fontisphaera persica]
MKKRNLILSGLLLLLVAGALGGIKALQIGRLIAAGQAFVPPPIAVATVVAREETWPSRLEAVGTVSAVQGVAISAEIPGMVREICFTDGAMVKEGDLLVRLDTSSEEAQLRAVEAQVELARLQVQRLRNLRQGDTVSQSELDTAEATLKATMANADAIRAVIAKKNLRAPFAGQLGLRQVHLGQYVEAGRALVTLQALRPVYVDFSLPQQTLGVLRTGLVVEVQSDAFPQRRFEGRLIALSPEVHADTRSLALRAMLPNTDLALRPGMFVRVWVTLNGEQRVLVIPATSVLSAPYGASVFVVEPRAGTNGPPGLAVRQQFVRLGRSQGDWVVVEAGLKAGDKVVNGGLFKLRNGEAVVENNELTPKPEKSPQPPDS